MTTQGWPGPVILAGAVLVGAVMMLSSCSLGQSLGSDPGNPAPSAATAPAPAASPKRAPWLQPENELTDYSTRLGNNRVAAATAIKLGRSLYAQQQYWEVYVTTDPSTPSPAYDPSNPSTLDLAAKAVSRVDVLIATESGGAIKAFGAGGAQHEKAELIGLAQQLLSLFPAAKTIGFQVLFGENNPHSNATYQAGHLDYHSLAG
jgi:hypothetical protein